MLRNLLSDMILSSSFSIGKSQYGNLNIWFEAGAVGCCCGWHLKQLMQMILWLTLHVTRAIQQEYLFMFTEKLCNWLCPVSFRRIMCANGRLSPDNFNEFKLNKDQLHHLQSLGSLFLAEEQCGFSRTLRQIWFKNKNRKGIKSVDTKTDSQQIILFLVWPNDTTSPALWHEPVKDSMRIWTGFEFSRQIEY